MFFRACANMSFGIVKSFAAFLLLLNFCMYIFVVAFAGWALNKVIDHYYVAGHNGAVPQGFSFSLTFPIGNEATGLMVIFALIAGVVGAGYCLSGLHHLRMWTAESLASSASSAMTAWALTLLAMGMAWKEIQLHGRSPNLITLEFFVIILCATKLLYMMLIQAGFFAEKYFSYGERHVATTIAESQKGESATA